MVKGISKQVIVVQSPDPRLFEQAIFILREDAVGEQGITDEMILREARLAAKGYLEGHKKTARRLPPGFWALGGALATGLVWALTVLL